MWLGWGEQGTPVPGGGGRGQSPPALTAVPKASDLMLQAEGATGNFKAGARSHHPQPPRVSPSAGSCPALGEEVSRETTGPHLQGADGKGSETGVRSWWVRGFKPQSFDMGAHGPGGGGAQKGDEVPMNPDTWPLRPHAVQLADWGSSPAQPQAGVHLEK